jgi:hypothetical protein
MKILFFFFLLASSKCFCQDFGVSQVLVYPTPEKTSDMIFYNWYEHPEEKDIYIMSFERSLAGFKNAFDELSALLLENNLQFNSYFSDQSKFHHSIEKKYTFEELHSSVVDKKSKVFRTWNAGNDYLTLLLNHDVYMMILGDKDNGRSN